MDILLILNDDHYALWRELAEIAGRASGGSETRKMLREFIIHYEAHESIEEEILFPALGPFLRDNDNEWVADLRKDHSEVWSIMDHMVESLNSSESGMLHGEIMTLQRFLHLHFHEEETLLFPKIRDILDPQILNRMGNEAHDFMTKFNLTRTPISEVNQP